MGVPVQVFRAVTALAIAHFVIRIPRVFEIERKRQLNVVIQQRFETIKSFVQTWKQPKGGALKPKP